jgi:hypothetical protein
LNYLRASPFPIFSFLDVALPVPAPVIDFLILDIPFEIPAPVIDSIAFDHVLEFLIPVINLEILSMGYPGEDEKYFQKRKDFPGVPPCIAFAIE